MKNKTLNIFDEIKNLEAQKRLAKELEMKCTMTREERTLITAWEKYKEWKKTLKGGKK